MSPQRLCGSDRLHLLATQSIAVPRLLHRPLEGELPTAKPVRGCVPGLGPDGTCSFTSCSHACHKGSLSREAPEATMATDHDTPSQATVVWGKCRCVKQAAEARLSSRVSPLWAICTSVMVQMSSAYHLPKLGRLCLYDYDSACLRGFC